MAKGSAKELTGTALAQTLRKIREHEKIPASQRRTAIRARLLESYGEINLTVIPTHIGYLGLAWNARGVVGLQLPRGDAGRTLLALQRQFPDGRTRADAPPEIVQELQEYAAGRNREFHMSLDWSTIKPFQRAVLKVTSRIPFGETRTYAWVAQQIGKPRAARAVGRALATNPIPIILPCHRVIGSDGGLHGYGGGLPLKARLLRLEGVPVSDTLIAS